MNGHSVTIDATKAERLKEVTGEKTYKAAVDRIITRYLGAQALKQARENLDGKPSVK